MINKKKILFATAHYPPNNTGAAVVMHNLIKGLNRDCIGSVVTYANSASDRLELIDGIEVHKLFRRQHRFPIRVRYFIRRLLSFFELQKMIELIKDNEISHVVCVYPDLEFFYTSMLAAKRTNSKFYPYFHDTMVESLSHKFYRWRSVRIQKTAFELSTKVFVMSEGLQELYLRKYSVNTVPLLHSLNENIDDLQFTISSIENSFFWGGNVYSINRNCVVRLQRYCVRTNMDLSLSAANNMKSLIKQGLDARKVRILPFLSREEYLVMLRSQKALLLAIDWPDESSLHIDELSTIFPTKTIEYLISGRPIIVHCPENYFLAKFFKKFDCGIVLTSRDDVEIQEKLNDYLNDEMRLRLIISNAFKVSKFFDVKNVVKVFNDNVF